MEKSSKKDKILIGVSIVSIGVAGYFGYKCYEKDKALKLAEEGRKIAEEEKEKLVEKLISFILLINESECIAKAKQNCNNKIARAEGKIQGIIAALDKQPNNKPLKVSLQKYEAKYKSLKYQSENLNILEELVKTDDNNCVKNALKLMKENKLVLLCKNGIDQGKILVDSNTCADLDIAS